VPINDHRILSRLIGSNQWGGTN